MAGIPTKIQTPHNQTHGTDETHGTTHETHSTNETRRLPYNTTFPHAFGTGIIISTSQPIPQDLYSRLTDCIETIDRTLSRFREDSLISAMRQAPHGGSFTFPTWCQAVFDCADMMFHLTQHALDPCVGEELGLLGYGPALQLNTSNTTNTNIATTWATAISREQDQPTILHTTAPVALDFGAFGKGFAVDRIAQLLETYPAWQHNKSLNAHHPSPSLEYSSLEYVINAGGDVRVLLHTNPPYRIGLEDPHNPSFAIGVMPIQQGALCASSPSRRHWEQQRFAAMHTVHHLLDARTGQPVQDTLASWAAIPLDMLQQLPAETTDDQRLAYHLCTKYPTMIADALTTALFTTSATTLSTRFAVPMLALDTSYKVSSQYQWYGTLFTATAD